ncbi:hypothetical protein ATO6_18065 [Oceanicola sp. 22II-s10i]|uniref:MaoC/PaaZ C-terminal domain-containing protein n=1 Tax=Oceanicola sp. 22II-s10i TaxID=1317116 RepID=UPI000B69741F|nr:MaoC/PaaZ C-terminal domain-containing protein [Oceanicola sp. 22II-s10i]OWU83753.1 hypothetical protein ATO6_18065 [Oceanicola sp. 22II-s10i]
MNKPATGTVIPRAGYDFTPRRDKFDRKAEERMMGVIGGDAALFRGGIDPAAFIPHAIKEAVRNGISSDGMVNMMQHIVVEQMVGLDDDIDITGGVAEATETPRGIVWVADTDYRTAGEARGVLTRRTALMTDPTQKADPTARGTIPRPEPAITDPEGLRTVATVTVTPDETILYCGGHGNRIHTDLDFARNAGYRAPIIGGSHGVRYMTAALWREFAPSELDIDVMFRRPIFWDDTFDVRVKEEGGRPVAMCTARDGKVMSEIRINHMA